MFAIGQDKQVLIKNIRLNYHSINANKLLRKVTLDVEDFLDHTPDGGGELTGYFKKGSIVKMVEWIGLSYGNRIREYYLKDGKVFFIYEQFVAFQPTKTGLDHFKVKIAFEGRYYINNGKLIDKVISGKKPIEDDSANNINELLSVAQDDIKALTNKK
jgi:hypothetical protein